MTFDPALWRKSSRSGGSGNQCVEVAIMSEAVGVRDTKDQGQGPILSFRLEEWAAFVDDIRRGTFDLPA